MRPKHRQHSREVRESIRRCIAEMEFATRCEIAEYVKNDEEMPQIVRDKALDCVWAVLKAPCFLRSPLAHRVKGKEVMIWRVNHDHEEFHP